MTSSIKRTIRPFKAETALTFFIPDLQGLAPKAVQDGQNSRLESVLEHLEVLILDPQAQEPTKENPGVA